MPRARLSDVAQRAGVSPATASLVLRGRPGPSEATRRAVQGAATELGYRPDRSASTLARKRSHLVGVVLDVRHPFHADLVDALDGVLAPAGLDLVLATTTTRRSEHEAIETLLDSRCAAVVLLGSTLGAARLEAIAAGCPTVVLGRRGTRLARGVWADDAHGLELVVAHLAGLGHERIAWVDGGRSAIATARRRGYRAAMRRHGLSEHVHVLAGGMTEGAGLRAGEHLGAWWTAGDGAWRAAPDDPRGTPPTAVAAFNDRCAIGVREALLRVGVGVPEGMSLVGYDDSPLARLATIDLTSVSQDAGALAEATAGVVERLLAGEAATDVVVEPRLVVRSSTRSVTPGGAPRHGAG